MTRRRSGWMARVGLAAAALGITTACSEAVAPDAGARVAIEPPEVYRAYWVETEACSASVGAFSRVRWFVVDEFGQGPGILGQWNERHEITLRVDSWLERDVVMHEILHDLLNGDPHHQHPAWSACGLPVGIG